MVLDVADRVAEPPVPPPWRHGRGRRGRRAAGCPCKELTPTQVRRDYVLPKYADDIDALFS
jgi:hypothetical protein